MIHEQIFYYSDIIPRLLSPDHGSLLYHTPDKEGQFKNISLLPAKLSTDFSLEATALMKTISFQVDVPVMLVMEGFRTGMLDTRCAEVSVEEHVSCQVKILSPLSV